MQKRNILKQKQVNLTKLKMARIKRCVNEITTSQAVATRQNHNPDSIILWAESVVKCQNPGKYQDYLVVWAHNKQLSSAESQSKTQTSMSNSDAIVKFQTSLSKLRGQCHQSDSNVITQT